MAYVEFQNVKKIDKSGEVEIPALKETLAANHIIVRRP